MKMRMINLMLWVMLVILMTAGLGHADLNDGLMAYYPFNGNTDEETGNYPSLNNYGAFSTFDQFGNPDGAYRLNGAGENMAGKSYDIINPSAQGSFAVSFWFSPLTTWSPENNPNALIVGNNDGDQDWGIHIMGPGDGIHPGTIGFWWIGAKPGPTPEGWLELVTNTKTWYNGTWYHIAVSYYEPTTNFSIWVNGFCENQMTVTDDIGQNLAENILAIGRYEAESPYPNMDIDELRLYNRALTPDEIDELANPNTSPVADAGSEQILEATSPDGASVTLDGSGSTDSDSTTGTNDDIVSFNWFEGTIPLGSGETIPYTFPLGSHTVTLVVTDSSGETDSDETMIIVEDTTPPVITLNSDATITLECGIDVYEELGATASDICDPIVSVVIGGDTVDTTTCGTYIVTYNATDACGNTAIQATRTVTVEDTLPPEIIAAIVEPQVVEVGQTVNYDAVIGDECGFTVEWDFGDGNPASSDNPTTHIYDYADIYTVTLTATDTSGNFTTEEFFVVVYDISGGFVTGGGWIWSPAGALMVDQDIEGKANFGFVSKYKKGANVPTGQTEFVFQAGDLNFHSSSYDWFVVNQNDSNAQFKGSGTINGEGDYKFMLWAGDHDPDTFRIKIWYEDGTEVLVYDNGNKQPIGGGSIVIHTN
jgi:hypothetical protein